MRRTFLGRVAMIVLVASLAVPAMAAPREDSPIDRFDRVISQIMAKIQHVVTDLTDQISIPK